MDFCSPAATQPAGSQAPLPGTALSPRQPLAASPGASHKSWQPLQIRVLPVMHCRFFKIKPSPQGVLALGTKQDFSVDILQHS